MPKGSVCLFTGATLHAGGGNTTAAERRHGLLLGYVMGWLSQEQNFYVSVPPSVARGLDKGVQDVLGFPVTERGEGAYNASNNSAFTGLPSAASAGGIVF